MRVHRLDLTAFGPFTDLSLDLSAGAPGGLHVIYGLNEAGKSSSLKALICWLFGIPERTDQDFVHKKPNLQVGGELHLADGRSLAFTRHKRRKNPLVHTETGSPFSQKDLVPYLAGVDKDGFERIYGIDHRRLVEGSRELLEQSGDLGQALFSAASGTALVRDLLHYFKDQAGKLYKKGGSNAVIIKTKQAYNQARQDVKAHSLRADHWARRRADLQQAREDLAHLERRRGELTRSLARLTRLFNVLPLLATRRQHLLRLEELASAARLPDDFGDTWRACLERLRTAEDRLQHLEDQRARRVTERQEIASDEPLEARATTITELSQEIGTVRKASRDIDRQDGIMRKAREEAGQILARLRPGVGLDEAESLLPVLNRRRALSQLAGAREGLWADHREAESALAETSERLALLRRRLETTKAPAQDPAPLAAAVAAARKSGDLDARIDEQRQRARQEQDRCRAKLLSLGRFDGDLDQLRSAPFPVTATVERFAAMFQDLETRARDLRRQRQESTQQRDAATAELDRLRSSERLPTLDELDAARALRDTGWRLIRGRYIDPDTDPQQGASDLRASDLRADADLWAEQVGPGADLPASYEQQVVEADSISDRLRQSADRVQRRAQLEAEIRRQEKQLQGQQADEEALHRERHELEAAWRKEWEGARVEPATPAEMLQWLARAETLVALAQQATEAREDLERLQAERGRHIQALVAQLATLPQQPGELPASSPSASRSHHRASTAVAPGSEDDRPWERLGDLLALAEEHIRRVNELLEERRQLQEELDELESQVPGLEQRRQGARDRLNAWKDQWGELVQTLGLGPDAHPDEVLDVMEQHGLLFERLREADQASHRISGMQRDIREFAERVRKTAQDLGRDTDGVDPVELAERLHKDLQSAAAQRARGQKLDEMLAELEESIAETTLIRRSAEQELQDLRRQAGASSNEQLSEATRRSQQRDRLEEELREVEEQLLRLGGGLDLDALEREAANTDPDEVEEQLHQVKASLEEIEPDRDRLRDLAHTLEAELDAMDGSSQAAAAAEEAAALTARMAADAEQYLVLRTARLILQQQIERHRREHQAPVLRRAAQVFSRLTLGSFSGLRDDLDSKGNPILLGVRAGDTGPAELVQVSGMSDGTRDQLYLALRVATMLVHLEEGRGEPMPFVADDILVGFDDLRSLSALEVLADLAQRTQVLLFSHHKSVANQAEELSLRKGLPVTLHTLQSATGDH